MRHGSELAAAANPARRVTAPVFPALTRPSLPRRPGLRFGDQILQINEESVAGYDMDKVHGIFKKARADAIKVRAARLRHGEGGGYGRRGRADQNLWCEKGGQPILGDREK